MAPKITRENGREWERVGRDFGIIDLLWKTNVKMRREVFLLYEGERRDPSWMSYKCHPSKRERTSQGGRTFRVLEWVRVWGVRCVGGKPLFFCPNLWLGSKGCALRVWGLLHLYFSLFPKFMKKEGGPLTRETHFKLLTCHGGFF